MISTNEPWTDLGTGFVYRYSVKGIQKRRGRRQGKFRSFAWLRDNILSDQRPYIIFSQPPFYLYYFREEQDAIMFTLACGDELAP